VYTELKQLDLSPVATVMLFDPDKVEFSGDVSRQLRPRRGPVPSGRWEGAGLRSARVPDIELSSAAADDCSAQLQLPTAQTNDIDTKVQDAKFKIAPWEWSRWTAPAHGLRAPGHLAHPGVDT
jgi:hypothetical protein